MLRCRGLGIAVHELLADVCAIFERHCLYVVVVVFAHGTIGGWFSFLRVLGHETGQGFRHFSCSNLGSEMLGTRPV